MSMVKILLESFQNIQIQEVQSWTPFSPFDFVFCALLSHADNKFLPENSRKYIHCLVHLAKWGRERVFCFIQRPLLHKPTKISLAFMFLISNLFILQSEVKLKEYFVKTPGECGKSLKNVHSIRLISLLKFSQKHRNILVSKIQICTIQFHCLRRKLRPEYNLIFV